jgi:signal peptidase I
MLAGAATVGFAAQAQDAPERDAVIVNGEPIPDDFIKPCGSSRGCNLPKEITIPPDHYFMMGDNRGSSDDSRFWGPVPKDWIIGKAFATYWPLDRIGLL